MKLYQEEGVKTLLELNLILVYQQISILLYRKRFLQNFYGLSCQSKKLLYLLVQYLLLHPMTVPLDQLLGIFGPGCLRLHYDGGVVVVPAHSQVIFIVPCPYVCVVNYNHRHTIHGSLLCTPLAGIMGLSQLLGIKLIPEEWGNIIKVHGC